MCPGSVYAVVQKRCTEAQKADGSAADQGDAVLRTIVWIPRLVCRYAISSGVAPTGHAALYSAPDCSSGAALDRSLKFSRSGAVGFAVAFASFESVIVRA